MFELNEIIWVYDAPCYPKKGIIIETNVSGLNYYYKVKFLDKNIKNYTENNLFKYPTDKEKMIDKILDDGYSLLKYAKEIDLEEVNNG